MATIASLNIDIAANTAKFRSGLGQAAGGLKSFASTVAAIAGGGLLSEGISAAVGKMKELVSGSFESIDAVAKMSDKIGIQTEALLGLQYAAGQAGIGTEAFNNSMLKFQKNIGEASIGTASAVAAFESVGLNVADIVAMKPEDAFKATADAIKELGSPAQRVSAAMDLFGKSGTELIPMLIQGSEEIEEMTKRNEELGGSFSRIDAEKVVAAGDAMQDLGKFIENVAKHIAIQLSPFITAATEALIEMGTEGSTVGEKVTGAFEMVAKSVAVAADFFELLKAGWYTAQAGIAKGIQFLISGFVSMGNTINDIYEKITGEDLGLKTVLTEFSDGLGIEAENSLKAFDEAYSNFENGKASQGVTAFFDKIKTKATEAATFSAQKAAKAATNVAEVVDSEFEKTFDKLIDLADKIFEKTRTPLEKFEKEVTRLAGLFQLGLIDEDTFNRAAKMAQDEVEKTNKKKTAKDGEFKQIDLQNISVEGLKSRKTVQTVKDPQLEKTNAILSDIRRNIGVQQPVMGA